MSASEMENIDVNEARTLLQRGAILLDVREAWEYNDGHAVGATHIPMSQLEARIDELDAEASILVICQAGPRSTAVTAALNEAGYSAINVVGGMSAWRAAGLEVESSTPAADA